MSVKNKTNFASVTGIYSALSYPCFPNFPTLLPSKSLILRAVELSSHELLSLPKNNMKSEGSGNITGLKFENCTHTGTRPCTRSAILTAETKRRGDPHINL